MLQRVVAQGEVTWLGEYKGQPGEGGVNELLG